VTDPVTLIVTVFGVMIDFTVEPDTTGQVEAGKVVTYLLRLDYDGNVDDVIDLEVKGVGEQWSVELGDSLGNPLSDYDHDGRLDLGLLTSGCHRFSLKVKSPAWSGLVGEIFKTYCDTVLVFGYGSKAPEIDSCQVATVMVPPLDVHNYPNPFQGMTAFIFSLPEAGTVTLRVYNRAGELIQEVIRGRRYDLGIYRVSWDGRNRFGKRCSPGLYLYLFEFHHRGKTDRVMKKLLIRG
jgi:hypothetical protein